MVWWLDHYRIRWVYQPVKYGVDQPGLATLVYKKSTWQLAGGHEFESVLLLLEGASECDNSVSTRWNCSCDVVDLVEVIFHIQDLQHAEAAQGCLPESSTPPGSLF
jgi:hypothetical protein